MSELTFGIALISKRIAADWPTVEKLLASDAPVSVQSERPDPRDNRLS